MKNNREIKIHLNEILIRFGIFICIPIFLLYTTYDALFFEMLDYLLQIMKIQIRKHHDLSTIFQIDKFDDFIKLLNVILKLTFIGIIIACFYIQFVLYIKTTISKKKKYNKVKTMIKIALYSLFLFKIIKYILHIIIIDMNIETVITFTNFNQIIIQLMIYLVYFICIIRIIIIKKKMTYNVFFNLYLISEIGELLNINVSDTNYLLLFLIFMCYLKKKNEKDGI